MGEGDWVGSQTCLSCTYFAVLILESCKCFQTFVTFITLFLWEIALSSKTTDLKINCGNTTGFKVEDCLSDISCNWLRNSRTEEGQWIVYYVHTGHSAGDAKMKEGLRP